LGRRLGTPTLKYQHVTKLYVGKEKNEMHTKFLLERLMGDQLEDTDLGGRIMLR
jgi:hypothetical protein